MQIYLMDISIIKLFLFYVEMVFHDNCFKNIYNGHIFYYITMYFVKYERIRNSAISLRFKLRFSITSEIL